MKFISWNVNGLRAAVGKGFMESFFALGADICCDSAHKTLPVLTGGAYLHCGNEKYIDGIKEAMSLFGSSSPSYLILQSLDLCNAYLDGDFKSDLSRAVNNVRMLKDKLGAAGYHICGSEPLKLTVYACPSGKTGFELAECLCENGVEAEYADITHVMLMFSAATPDEDYERVENAFMSIPMPRIYIKPPLFELKPPIKAMTPREAYFLPDERVLTDNCLGRICAKASTVCPPCVPVAAGGEVFDENSIKILKMYSISEVNVLK